MATQLHSAPNSQASSFEDTFDSQSSHRPLSSGDPRFEAVQRENTPPTSLSNPSSQELMAEKVRPPTSGLTLETRQDSALTASTVDLTASSKRTADGRVKERRSTPASPTGMEKHGHSRNSSMASKGSQIGELSNQLKTRLSYAMVKVQHGWQSHNISELEVMTSAQNSPVSTTSTTLRKTYESPRPSSQGFTQSSERSTATPEYSSYAPQRPYRRADGHDHAYPESRSVARSPSSTNTTRTYESFWRENAEFSPQSTSSKGPSLAPPADITPRNARRSNMPNVQPPLLRPQSSSGEAASVPVTPQKPPMRTPSQAAAMEKDAVETLIFMSSPKNSGYCPNTRQQNQKTPLRNQLVNGVRGREPVEAPARGRQRLDVEALIDGMGGGEASSSSEEDDLPGR